MHLRDRVGGVLCCWGRADACEDVLICLANDPGLLEVLPLLNGGGGMRLMAGSRDFIEVSRPLSPTLAPSSIAPNTPHAAARLAAPHTVPQLPLMNL